MSTERIEILKEVIVKRAGSMDHKVEMQPKVLLMPHFRSSNALGRLGGPVPTEEVSQTIRSRMYGVTVGSCSLLIVELDKDFTDSDWRQYYTQAAVARSWMGDKEIDLCLILIGPPGSALQEKWQRFARSMDRDESVCRKLVWLPSVDESPATIRKEAERFIDRTFLAQPWVPRTDLIQHDLDALNVIYRELGTAFSEKTQLSGAVLKKWLRILEQPDESQQVAHELFQSSKVEK